MDYVIVDGQLYHHGVKGMKWGFRRYQKKDGTLTPAGKTRYNHEKVVIPKGSTVQRISKEAKERQSGKTYISFKELDNLQYEATAGTDGLWWTANYDPNNPQNSNYGYKIKLKVTNDIIAPSYDETINAFVETVKRKPLKELVVDTYGDKKDQNTSYQKKKYRENTKRFVKDMRHLKVDEARERAYLAYSRSLMTSKSNQKEFFDELQKRGYNAVVDHNDAVPKNGSSGAFDMPVIVFERSTNLKQVSATPISDRDRENAEQKILDKRLIG